MRITLYDTRITEELNTILVKEKAMNYKTDRLNNPSDIAEMMCDLFEMDIKAEEHCYIICLNTKCRVIGVFFISKGTVNQSLLSTREIFLRAILVGAVNIILLHNHPSMDTTPSKEDINVTKKMKEAGDLMDIKLLDHIIVARNGYYSFKEMDRLS